jgi:hypothetical protein
MKASASFIRFLFDYFYYSFKDQGYENSNETRYDYYET